MVCSSLPHNFRNWSIQSLSDEREIDWKDEFRSGDSKPTTVEAVNDEDKGKTTDTWSGELNGYDWFLLLTLC